MSSSDASLSKPPMRKCPGVGGKTCGSFMSPVFRDPHPTCAVCRGIKCDGIVTCDLCNGWSVRQWLEFRKKKIKKPRSSDVQRRGSADAQTNPSPSTAGYTPARETAVDTSVTDGGSEVTGLAHQPIQPHTSTTSHPSRSAVSPTVIDRSLSADARPLPSPSAVAGEEGQGRSDVTPRPPPATPSGRTDEGRSPRRPVRQFPPWGWGGGDTSR